MATGARIIVESNPVEDMAIEAAALVLTAPISFWGGVDPNSGTIIDVRHPQHGNNIAGKILFVPATVGSSTASTILLELVHGGNAPAALVLHQADAILLLGLIAARELGLKIPPALILNREHHGQFREQNVQIGSDGSLRAT